MTKKRQKPAKQEAKETTRLGGLKFLIALAVAIVAIGLFTLRHTLFPDPEKQTLLISIEKIDLTGMEAQVAGKIKKVREDVKENPDSDITWGKLAMNLDVHDLEKESIPLYKEAAKLNSSDFRWPYFCAISLSQMGSGESLRWFEQAVKIKPDYVPLRVHYGDALFHAGKIDMAGAQYRQAIAQDPAAAHAFFGLAQIAFSKGDMPASRTNLQKAFEINPSFGEAYNLLASVCRRMNDTNCAQQASNAAKDLPAKTPLPDPVYSQVADEGVSSLWHRARGSEYMKQKSYDAAIQEFQKALQIRSDTQTHEDLAQALSSAGRLPEAAREYQTVTAQHPTAQNYFGLGLVYAKMGSYDQAQEYFKKAAGKKSDFAEAYFNLAVAYAKTGRLQDTMESLKQAVRIRPDYTEAHYRLALAYLAANDGKGAQQEYKILQDLDPNIARQLRALIEQNKASNITTE